MDKFDRLSKRTKKNIEELKNFYPGATLEAEKVETMIGTTVIHIYLVLRSSTGSIYLKKHICTCS